MRIATRASPLARAQAGQVAELLGAQGADAPVELVALTTSGDRGSAGHEDKGRWVRELEQALLDGRADLAVHSAKDVPSELPEGLELVGCPARADPRDVLCGVATVQSLPRGARVGTSSLRRQAQLRALREDLEVLELRGNVDTRLRRLADGDYDAIVVAAAGLARLGRAAEAGGALDADLFVPAAGQGTLALQARRSDEQVRARVRAIADPQTEAQLWAERALVRELGADCDTPVGAHASCQAGGGLALSAWVGRAEGTAWLRDRLEGDDPEALGRTVAQRLFAAGAADLLGR